MPSDTRPGDVLAGRYHLDDLLSESHGGSFWRAHDSVLARHVALHVISDEDERAEILMAAARRSATVNDRRLLRVLDAESRDGMCFVVNEWGSGVSLDIMLANEGPLAPRRAAWIVSEVGVALATAHAAGVAHGRLNPENVLVDHSGTIRVIGFAVDAALHGLPEGRQSTDVLDLASLLYAALTARWPGPSDSEVPDAPDSAGRVLRPRQVRAGIPRVLDDICDAVLNPEDLQRNGGTHLRTEHDLTTARGITEALCEYVGDPADLAAHEAARHHGEWVPGAQPPGTVQQPAREQLPTVPAPVGDPGGDTGSGATDPAATAVEQPTVQVPAATTQGDDQDDPGDGRRPQEEASAGEDDPDDGELAPTEAGLPIFDESGEVSWMDPRSTRPPPPPPLEEPPARPLFDPESPPGSRLHRNGSRWSGTGGTDGGAEGTGHGSGSLPPAPEQPWISGDPAFTGTMERDRVPGRSWMRLAGIIAAIAALVLTVFFAYQLGAGNNGGGEDPGADQPDEEETTSPPEPIQVASASDLDPQGNGEENPESVGQAIDGDPSTTWRTLTYEQDFGPGGLKTGLGLALDLGESTGVREVVLEMVGEPTGVEVYVSGEQRDSPEGLEPVATGTVGTQETLELPEGTEGRFVTLWFTSLPTIPDGFRAEVAEVEVRG